MKLSPEHKAAMLAGRRNANGAKSNAKIKVLLPEQAEAVKRAIPSCRGIYISAFEGKSKSAALKAKCLDCTCDQRVKITNCPIIACPLWQYRPYQRKGAK